MVQKKIKLLVIAGPTAVGKSAIAVSAALKLGGEAVSADSMQIYKGMNIGTGKITPAEMCGVPHHMLDVAAPNDDYSVGRYVVEARSAIEGIVKRNKLPIVVGGTGLYINSLLFGHSFAGVPKDDAVRSELKDFAERNGAKALHDRLYEVDPESADKIEVNDVKRVIRALEIYTLTGKPRSSRKDECVSPYDFKLIVLCDDRAKLCDRIDARVDKMVESGLVDEVKGLYEYKDCNSMQAIGYKEIISYLDGKLSLDEAIEQVKLGSRRYAKRQMTFFRGMKAEKTFVDIGKFDLDSIVNNF